MAVITSSQPMRSSSKSLTRPHIARQEQPRLERVLEPARDLRRLLAVTAEEIRAQRAADRAAGVLRHHQALELPIGLVALGDGQVPSSHSGTPSGTNAVSTAIER